MCTRRMKNLSPPGLQTRQRTQESPFWAIFPGFLFRRGWLDLNGTLTTIFSGTHIIVIEKPFGDFVPPLPIMGAQTWPRVRKHYYEINTLWRPLVTSETNTIVTRMLLDLTQKVAGQGGSWLGAALGSYGSSRETYQVGYQIARVGQANTNIGVSLTYDLAWPQNPRSNLKSW